MSPAPVGLEVILIAKELEFVVSPAAEAAVVVPASK
jgi:hypothetical protein